MKFIIPFFTGVICLFVSCTGTSEKFYSEVSCSFLSDSIKSGDLICRLGNGFFSNYFKKYSGGNNRFSHIGIIHKEDSCLYVIHADASELSGKGSVRMDSLIVFLRNSLDYEFYQVDSDSLGLAIDSIAFAYYKIKTPFDLSFDCTNDSALYCSELVANCINKAIKEKDFIPTYRLRPEFDYYRIIDIIESGVIKR